MAAPTRRELLALAAGATLLGTDSFGSDSPRSPDGILRIPGDNSRRFPILFAGESLLASTRIRTLEFGRPLFGRYRPEVNPRSPAVKSGELMTFHDPGEYYPSVNGSPAQKVLVLDPRESFSASVLRIFDFTVANMLYHGYDDNSWYQDWDVLIDWWFRQPAPLSLSCGPTHAVFRRLIQETFDLPVRVVTYPGTWLRAGMVRYATHNVAEVYLPDREAFVAFDVNNSLVCPWLDAMDLADRVRALKDLEPGKTFADIDLEMRKGVTTLRPKATLPATRATFSESMLSAQVVNPKDVLPMMYGGCAYWGGEVGWQKPTGTEFLPGHYQYASLHTLPLLRDAAVAWIESFNVPVTLVEPDELRCLLREGHAPLIAEQAWRRKVDARGISSA